MSSDDSYQEYVLDYQTHVAFEDQFFEEPRDRHKVMLDLVGEVVRDGSPSRLLDVCCSKGIFLAHVRRLYPELSLLGVDLGEELIAEAQKNPSLAGIDFQHADLLSMSFDEPFDIVTGNNALMFFDDAQYERAVSNIWDSLSPGGSFFTSDLYHPFDQDLKIVERNNWYPGELVTYHRSYAYVRRVFEGLGADRIDFRPFGMTKDLPRNDYGSLVSYTIGTEGGERLDMRGILLQPFCHFSAHKPA